MLSANFKQTRIAAASLDFLATAWLSCYCLAQWGRQGFKKLGLRLTSVGARDGALGGVFLPHSAGSV